MTNKNLEYTKIFVGLLPIISIFIYLIHWFVIGTMEHGWFCDVNLWRDCSHTGIHITQRVLTMLACTVMALTVIILGAREAHLAWKRLRGGDAS